MLRKFAYNKIFRTTGMLLLLLFLLLFPASREYSLEEETVIKTSKIEDKREVFLIDKDGYVARTKVALSKEDDVIYAKKLIELLIIGGKYEQKIPNGFKVILPSDTKINDVFINNDSITIDISNDILDLSEKDFSIALDLLTYNLTTVDNIKYLYINVDGKTLENVPGTNKVINYPLSRKNGVNRNFSATSYKDVNLTTIYYINKNNTGYYYVPVTKMNNDNRDKIKIIVDELTSSHTYETNLMSFLNYNTKLMNYELKDDVLTLNFNEFLFDDTTSKSILEEVIYSISLSIRDNYDVKEVIFTVDGNEITKSVIKNIE